MSLKFLEASLKYLEGHSKSSMPSCKQVQVLKQRFSSGLKSVCWQKVLILNTKNDANYDTYNIDLDGLKCLLNFIFGKITAR